MDVSTLLHFIDENRRLIRLYVMEAFLTSQGIFFSNEFDEKYSFELPPDLISDIAEAYREPGQVLDFTFAVMVKGIEDAENVLLVYARRRKLNLLLEE